MDVAGRAEQGNPSVPDLDLDLSHKLKSCACHTRVKSRVCSVTFQHLPTSSPLISFPLLPSLRHGDPSWSSLGLPRVQHSVQVPRWAHPAFLGPQVTSSHWKTSRQLLPCLSPQLGWYVYISIRFLPVLTLSSKTMLPRWRVPSPRDAANPPTPEVD